MKWKDELRNIELDKYLKRKYYYFYDPVRCSFTKDTPEEIVRQKMIKLLLKPKYGYHKDHMEIEHRLSNKKRADIVVMYPKSKNALIVIEIKAQGKPLTDDVKKQALDYAKKLNASFFAITNGDELEFYETKNSTKEIKTKIWKFKELIEKKNLKYKKTIKFCRTSLKELKKDGTIGKDTSKKYHDFISILYNFYLCRKFKEISSIYGFKILKDLGREYISHGNAAGGSWTGLLSRISH